MTDVTTPEWVKHAVFYQIFPDRFASSPRAIKPHNLEPWETDPTTFGYKGGDLYGVIEHLDDLVDLGITALYFNPIFQSASNHRYHTHDYFQIDPLLGGNAAFTELMVACKQRGLRVVLDGVFNHASRGFYQFNDILENGQSSPWLDWFFITEFPPNAYDPTRPPGYRCWFNLPALPKLNTDHPQVREFIMQVAEYWVRQGIDGWRLDVPNEISAPGFWQEFRQRVKAINPDTYIVGEIWQEAQQWLQGDQFDGVMNYPLNAAIIRFVVGDALRREYVENKGYQPWPALDGSQFVREVQRLLTLYPWGIQLTQLNLLDSHDTARFLSIANDDESSLHLGLLLLFTLPGAPSLYYGDEIGLTGGGTDALARRTFPWHNPDLWNHPLRALTKSLIALRHATPELRTGGFQPLSASGFVAVYARSGLRPHTTIVTAINIHTSPSTCTVLQRGDWQVLWGQASIAATAEGVTLTLPARQGAVFAVTTP